MNTVYEINGYLANNEMGEFDNIQSWSGKFILNSDGWIKGVAYIKDKTQVKEALIFGNFLPNKMIDFMIVGPNIVIGCTSLKTNNGYEGVPVIGNYTVYEDGTHTENYNHNKESLVIIDEKLELEENKINDLNNKASKILEEGPYIDFYNSIFSQRNERQQALEFLYKKYKGNVKALTRDII